MLNFLKERHKHNFKEVIWYSLGYDYGHVIYVYRAKICSCGKITKRRCIYQHKFSTFKEREEKIIWWEKHNAITEEEFAFRYR